MYDPELNFPKKRNFGQNTESILESLIQEGFLTLSTFAQSSSVNELESEISSEKIIERVERMFKKNSVLPESLNLPTLSKYVLKASKNSFITAQHLALSVNQLKGCSDHDIAKGLVKIIWICFRMRLEDEKKADNRVWSWIRKMKKQNIAKIQVNAIFRDMYLESIENNELMQKRRNLLPSCKNITSKDSIGLENHQNTLQLGETEMIHRQSDFFSLSFNKLLPLNFKDQDMLGILQFNNQDFLHLEYEELFFVNN